MEKLLFELMQNVSDETGKLKNIRHIGAIIAADLILDEKQKNHRYGYKVFQAATALGALMRPIGNTIYWLPPLNIKKRILLQLRAITIKAINIVL